MRKAYKDYKTTGIQWLPQIPRHWEILKLRQILSSFSEKNHPDMPLLSVVREKGVIIRNIENTNENHNYIPDDLTNYKLVKTGQFAMNKMKAWQGSYGVSDHDGIVSPAYFVFSFALDIDKQFFNTAIRSKSYVSFFGQASDGIRVGQWDLSMARMKNIPFYVPPREEQEQIVRFLDWKISSINKLINLKQQEITELKELKKATISDAVTHGLDKTVPMKDGGISWLGKIPQHWEILSLKHVSRINASIANEIAKLKDLDLVAFLPMENISETGNIDCSIKRPLKEVRSGFSSFSKSDVVIAKITPCFENGKGACLDELDTTIGFGTTELINLRANSRILPKFLYLITVLQEFRKLGERAMTGSAGQKRVPLTYIKNFTIGIPPIEEQKHILLEVDKRSKSIDKCILSKHEELKTLHDLKSSLIADVVTGQIDVRDVTIPNYETVHEHADEAPDTIANSLEADKEV